MISSNSGKRPFLSIITATHNRPELLKRMVDSVLAQSFQDWELIIIDDSTHDETEKCFSSITEDKRVTYQKNNKNLGLPESRNCGLNKAEGMWITLLDDDDMYYSFSSLAEVMTVLVNAEKKWITCNRVDLHQIPFTKQLVVKKEYNWVTDFLFNKSFRGDAVHFIHKSLLLNIRYRGTHRAEWYFWYDLAQKNNFSYFDLPIVQAEYLPDGMANLGYLKKERIYQGQQFREIIKHFRTWKYLPIIIKRYAASFVLVRKLINRLRNKQTSH